MGCKESFNNVIAELLLDALSKVIDIILLLILYEHVV